MYEKFYNPNTSFKTVYIYYHIMMELLKPFVHRIKIYKKDAKLIDVQGKRKPLQCCIKSQN